MFNLNFERIGEISEYNELVIERNYYKISQLILRIAPGEETKILLSEGNILTTTTNNNYGYYIDVFAYTDKTQQEIEVIAYSLNYFLSWRSIPKQQYASGKVENVIKHFANVNAINTTADRIIPNLRLAENSGIDINTESSKSGGEVLEHCFNICKPHEMTIDVLMNHEDKKFDVYTSQGEDRTTLQSINQPIIFSKEYDNIINQQYVRSRTDMKTTVFVAGEGEGINRKVVVADNNYSGFDRRELYADARDITRNYRDENNNDIVLSEAEYEALLLRRGIEKKSEFRVIETFESEVDMYSQFIFGVDYSLGDKVSIRNDEIGKILHTRVVQYTLVSNREGISFNINFGENVPSLFEKIKKKVVK